MTANKKAELKVAGMVCAACTAAIEKALRNLDGVALAQVNLGTETASVEYDLSGVGIWYRMDAQWMVSGNGISSMCAPDDTLDTTKGIGNKNVYMEYFPFYWSRFGRNFLWLCCYPGVEMVFFSAICRSSGRGCRVMVYHA